MHRIRFRIRKQGQVGFLVSVESCSLVKRLLEQGATEPLLEQLLGRRVQEVFHLPARDVFIPAYDALESFSLKSAGEYPWDSYRNLRLR